MGEFGNIYGDRVAAAAHDNDLAAEVGNDGRDHRAAFRGDRTRGGERGAGCIAAA